MKRLIALCLVLVLTLSLCACGTNSETPTDNPTSQENVNTGNSTADNKPSKDAEPLVYSHKVPGEDIIIDVPNWDPMELTHELITTVYKIHGTKYVSITSTDDAVNTVKEAHDVTWNAFVANMDRYQSIKSLSIKSDKTEKVNGLEMYKFEGTVTCHDKDNNGNPYDAYIIGYSFVMGGVPCSVIGSVQDVAQEKDMIAEMKATVEAMILTLRDKR